jgi:hypothetical protein
MYPNPEQLEAFAVYGLGFHVTRAGDTLPQGVTESLFTVTGGRCQVNLLFGECVTTVFSATDPVLSVVANPTTGTSVDLATTVDSKDLEVGGFLLAEGDGSALVKSLGGGIIFTAGQRRCVVNTGTIDLVAGDSQTGSMEWHLWYVPLDAGAKIEAA